ncbi:MAG: Tetrahydromethanopterin S-methyltransferase subunit G [Methanosaeta sp. PtaB.Bin039]|nr:MAG: Tetrahydromethanopterin S-methyltransferase subunit G [Methanosaeta sp. PtaB.Bin039]OPY45114.1 MAG: Tetrahydromethanopterin S-methyltransferase subunit G [Methanosaeta sp. PtaU1.Bin028]HOT07759.1 tetrahydromethanopterin S-methyltransferase subunit G [Methanotrichaceae archaeon]HQF16026.1 tetrahydromethanopterin S-methyltransferase subunit G [Methanotrichaceae archaeon]HQI90858.1 tetrahydromethanopterin S-methyltransferase subunit G [Methanotrichaceae archaeon]
MAVEGAQKVPVAVVDPDQYNEIMARLDKIEEKIEFYSGEKFLRAGKSVGRDLGAAYGVCAGLIIILAYILFVYGANWTKVI